MTMQQQTSGSEVLTVEHDLFLSFSFSCAKQVEFHLNGEQSKTGRRIAKIRNRKAKSRRKSRLKHQGDVSPTGDACDRKASSPGQRRPEPSSGSSCDSGSDRDSDYDSDSCDDDGHDDNDGESGGKEDGRTPTKNTGE